MKLRFISRGPANQISGGYLYNRYLMEYLRGQGLEVVYHQAMPDCREIGPGEIVIVDSLVLPETAPRLLPIARQLVLLLHVVPRDRGTRSDSRSALRSLCRQARVVVTGDNTLPLLRSVLASPSIGAVKIEPGVPTHWRDRDKDCYARSARRLLTIANYVRGKGLVRALDVLRQVERLPWTLTVYGNRDLDPAYFAAVAEKTRRYGLDDRVALHGSLPHDAVNESMLASDLLLHFSEHESYSTVIAEAIACGLPVLSHRTGNDATFAKSGLVRYFDCDDADAISALRSIIADDRAYAALRRTASIEERSWQKVGREFVEFLGLA